MILPDRAVAPWCHLRPETCTALWTAGLTTVESVEETTVRKLKALEGVTEREARKLRRMVPKAVRSVVVRPMKRGGQLRGSAAGRMRREVREACREAFLGRLDSLEEIADKGTYLERIRAIDVLGKYGIGTAIELTDAVKLEEVKRLVADLALATEPFIRESDTSRIFDAWNAAIRARFPAVAR